MKSRAESLVNAYYSTTPTYNLLENYEEIKTLGDLLESSYRYTEIESEIRRNLLYKLKNKENVFSEIIGYDDDVIPAVNRSLLAGHDILFVGQIGQAKTKLAEVIAKELLFPIPIIRGTITNDIPTTLPRDELNALLDDKVIHKTYPEFLISKEGEEIIRNSKLETPIEWISGDKRYRYLLATPDITIKDLVGQIDVIKVAKKGVEIYDIESYLPGQLLQARHGILCIDELPVLDPRKQVALLSILQEGKFTTGSFPVVFRPDAKIIATANPIDYTHSGKIIEPLFDRLKSHIDTHYPHTIDDEMHIIIQEIKIDYPNTIFIPIFILKSIAEITRTIRNHPDIDQDRGVSVRIGIHSLEIIISEAVRTRQILHSSSAIPRLTDLESISQTCKFELSELENTKDNRKKLLLSAIEKTIENLSKKYIENIEPELIQRIKSEFLINGKFVVSQVFSFEDYKKQLAKFPTLKKLIEKQMNLILEEQNNYLKLKNINNIFLSFQPEYKGDMMAGVTELLLECLKAINPPIIKRIDKHTYSIS